MDIIQEGQKLSINIVKDNKLVEMIATVSEVFDDRLTIELPQYFMRYVEFLDVGKPLTIKIFSTLGTIDFNTVVISSPLEDAFQVELDYNAVKFTPDKDFPSVDAIEQLRIHKDDESYIIRTSSISTEKMICLSDITLNINETLNCELLLPEEYGIISFKATVIERDIVYDNEYTFSCYGMNEEDRQSLLYYMYMYSLKYNQQVKNEENNG